MVSRVPEIQPLPLPPHSFNRYSWSTYSEPGAVPDTGALVVSGGGPRRAHKEYFLQSCERSRMRLGEVAGWAWG